MTSSILIFVVEDEESIRYVLEEGLTESGFALTVETDGVTAMAMLDAEGANYSALITDVKLPGKFSGWDIARRAHEINGKLPVIYITGDSSHEWGSKGAPNGQIMPKPFAMSQVVTAVSNRINARAAG